MKDSEQKLIESTEQCDINVKETYDYFCVKTPLLKIEHE